MSKSLSPNNCFSKSFRNNQTLCIAFFLLAAPVFLNAQTAYEIENLLQTKAVSYGQAAWFVLEAANVPGDFNRSSSVEAYRFAAERRWLGKAEPSEKVELRQVSLLIMQAFGVKGGPMYSLLKNPHYAYREMVYQDIIQGRADPGMSVSGELLLFLVSRFLYRIDDNPWELPEETEEPVAISMIPEETRSEEDLILMEEINAQIEALDMGDASVRFTDEGITISISNVQFLANSTTLQRKERELLYGIGQILKTVHSRKILIAGHTAQAGTEEDRRKTSLERAQAVADYLIQMGVRNKEDLIVQGYGSDRPIADNSTPQGMILNRRVEITILEDQ